MAPVLALATLSALTTGCGADDHQESLPLVQVGMTKKVAPIYDDGETKIFEVKKGIAFPILQPDSATERQLEQKDTEPYGRAPWIEVDDVEVQVSWTISNLDDEQHVVELLVDPWNEFGRYYPGLQVTDADEGKYMPNFSGIDKRYIVEPKSNGDASRAHGVYSYDDLKEVAIDFATVMALIKSPPEAPGGDDMEDVTVTYTNHAFQWQNRSFNDLLVKPWVPATIAGLTGLDLGFRTEEPATIAIEVEVEVVDKRGDRVKRDGEKGSLLPPSDEVITVGVAPP
jgi:hypothetical protein